MGEPGTPERAQVWGALVQFQGLWGPGARLCHGCRSRCHADSGPDVAASLLSWVLQARPTWAQGLLAVWFRRVFRHEIICQKYDWTQPGLQECPNDHPGLVSVMAAACCPLPGHFALTPLHGAFALSLQMFPFRKVLLRWEGGQFYTLPHPGLSIHLSHFTQFLESAPR